MSEPITHTDQPPLGTAEAVPGGMLQGMPQRAGVQGGPPGPRIAVIGAGPVGLSLALHAARALPQAQISLFDARPAGLDAARDPRTLALSLGSIQLLERLDAWEATNAQPILQVHVSQQAPAFAPDFLGDPCVRISAAEEGVPHLGAVLSYGAIVAPLERVWLAAERREPKRLTSRFGTAVAALRNLDAGIGAARPGPRGVQVEVDSGLVEHFDLAVVAEGGVFADQARKSLRHDYGQTAWVGQVTLQGPQRGIAYERFTHHGPVALLPLPDLPGAEGLPTLHTEPSTRRAALVWCVPNDDDPVRELNDLQRLAVLNTLFHADTGMLATIGPLKHFALGLNAERSLSDGRIVRIGNAAQTLHPVAGQGLNLGLRDAFELVRRLSRAEAASRADVDSGAGEVHAASGIDRVLSRLEWSRAPDRWSMIAATDFLARSFTWRLPGLGLARGFGLAALQAARPVKSALARQMMYGRR